MTGADRYTDALAGLREYHKTGNPLSLQEAMVNATLAAAAATALQAVLPLAGGDADEVNEWAGVILPSLKTIPTRLSEAEAEEDRLRELLHDAATEFVACGEEGKLAAKTSVGYVNTWRQAVGMPPIDGVVESIIYPEWWPPRLGDIIDGADGEVWVPVGGNKLAATLYSGTRAIGTDQSRPPQILDQDDFIRQHPAARLADRIPDRPTEVPW